MIQFTPNSTIEKVKATEEFDGHATMGGYIKVYGNPDRFYENSGMGGEISGGRDN